MAQLRTQPIDAKMYRHFAVITVAITLTIGVFADGEGRQALANGVSEEVAERQEAARVAQAQVDKFGKPELIRRSPPKPRGDWGYGDTFDSSYGQPNDGSASSSVGSAVWRGRSNPNAKVPGAYTPYGIPQAQWDAMSEEEREAFLGKRPKPQPIVSAAQHQREVNGLMAASAARAGEASEGGD
jgi:hypothetical protein